MDGVGRARVEHVFGTSVTSRRPGRSSSPTANSGCHGADRTLWRVTQSLEEKSSYARRATHEVRYLRGCHLHFAFSTPSGKYHRLLKTSATSGSQASEAWHAAPDRRGGWTQCLLITFLRSNSQGLSQAAILSLIFNRSSHLLVVCETG